MGECYELYWLTQTSIKCKPSMKVVIPHVPYFVFYYGQDIRTC